MKIILIYLLTQKKVFFLDYHYILGDDFLDDIQKYCDFDLKSTVMYIYNENYKKDFYIIVYLRDKLIKSKYEFIDETINVYKHTLHRIRRNMYENIKL